MTGAVLFIVLVLVSLGFILGPQISDWFDDLSWSIQNRREYRRITKNNPQLRPETLAAMSQRAYEEWRKNQ